MSSLRIIIGDPLAAAASCQFLGGDLPVIALPLTDMAVATSYHPRIVFNTRIFSIIYHRQPTNADDVAHVLSEISILAAQNYHSTIFLTSLTSPTTPPAVAATAITKLLPDIRHRFRNLHIVIPPEMDMLPLEQVFDQQLQQFVMRPTGGPRPADWYRSIGASLDPLYVRCT